MLHAHDFRRLIDIVSAQPRPSSFLREYLDQQYYAALFEDDRLAYLYKQYGEKAIPAHWAMAQATTPPDVLNGIEGQPGKDEAEKVINYIASFDPTANHQYSQWLIIRWLKNGYLLEDLSRAREYLEVFNRVKHQLQQKDINKYPNLTDLYQAIEPFTAGQQVAVSKRDEKRDLHTKMSQPPEAKIIFDNPQIKIVHPLTQEASCYWGQNTQWCTAAVSSNNYFQSYNDRAPLYIILIKAENKRYQFQFGKLTLNYKGSSYYEPSYFMDENDRGIDLKGFLKKYPIVFQAFGEKMFIPVMSTIGLEFFSKEATKMMDARKLQEAIHSMDDLKKTDPETWEHMDLQTLGNLPQTNADVKVFPEKIQRSIEFQKGLVQPISVYDNASMKNAVIKRVKLLTVLPPDYYADNLAELVMFIPDVAFGVPEEMVTPNVRESLLAQYPNKFSDFPDAWRTVPLAHLVADKFADRGQYIKIEDHIPEPWRDSYVMDKYWRARAGNDPNLHLDQLPHSYWDKEIISKLLSNHPKDMVKHIGVLTENMINLIANYKRYEEAFMKEIPEQFRTKTLYDEMVERDKNIIKDSYSLGQRQRQVYSLFPSVFWDKKATDALLASSLEITHFDQINPDLHRNPEIVAKFLLKDDSRVAEVPDASVSRDMMMALVKDYDYKKRVPKILAELSARGLVTEDDAIYIAANQNKSDYYYKIPKVLRTEPVVAAFAKTGVVPISGLTKPLQTEDVIKARLENYPEEFKDVPAKFRTPEFALKMARVNERVITAVPTDLLSEPLLWFMLKKDHEPVTRHYYHASEGVAKTNFGRFPQELWSDRTVAAAIDKQLLKPKMDYYEEYTDEDVAVAILRHDPEQYKDFPRTVTTSPMLAKVAMKNPYIVLQLDPSQITEEIAFEAIDKGGHYWKRDEDNFSYDRDNWNKSDNRSKIAWDHIPRSVFSKRIYMSAVGRLIDLKDVPSKYRDDAMRKKAVLYHPRNVLAISHPVEFLNKYLKDADRSKTNEQWVERLEHAGFIWTRKSGWFDIRTLEKKTLSTGYKVAVQESKVNFRVYLFSPKDKFLMYFYTLKNVVHFPYKALTESQLAKYQPSIVEVVRKYFLDTDISTLNEKTKVYKIHNNALAQNQLSKKNVGPLQVTEVEHNKEMRYEFFLQGKPILVLGTRTGGGGWGNSGTVGLSVWEVEDYPAVIQNAVTIGDYAKATHHALESWQFDDIGVLVTKSDTTILARTKIGRVGDLVVYRANTTPERISVFDLSTKSLVGTAKMKTKGDDVYGATKGRYGSVDENVMKLLRKAAEYVNKTKNVAGHLEFDKDVP